MEKCNKLWNLSKARENAGLSQEQLSEKIGVNRVMVTYWENGTRLPKTRDLIKLRDVLDVSIDYILGLTTTTTANVTIQSMEQLTGLSEKAIKNVSTMKENLTPVDWSLPSINFLLEHNSDFFDLFFHFCCADKSLFLKNHDDLYNGTIDTKDLDDESLYSKHYAYYNPITGTLTESGGGEILSNNFLLSILSELKKQKNNFLQMLKETEQDEDGNN